jgi:hypothetical protein
MRINGLLAVLAILCTAGSATAQYDYYGNRGGRQNYNQQNQSYYNNNQGYGAQPYPQPCYSNSILALAPVQLTENGFGIGVSWERNLDRYGWVTFQVPAILTFNMANDKITGEAKNDLMFYFMPGIKIYTNLNSPSLTKFAVGPSIVLGAGRGTVLPAYAYNSYSEKESRFLLGAMGNVSANLFPAPHLYLGAEYGLGFSYINTYGGVNKGVGFLTQLSLKIGYTYVGR